MVDVKHAIKVAATASCRTCLEKFGNDFVNLHKAVKLCPFVFSEDPSMTSVFRHFDACPGVTKNFNKKLGDTMSDRLDELSIKLPSSGDLVTIYRRLSSKLHSTELFTTEIGKVIVPSDLPLAEKRFWIRFFIANNHEIMVLDHKGLREATDEEISMPEKKRKIDGPTEMT